MYVRVASASEEDTAVELGAVGEGMTLTRRALVLFSLLVFLKDKHEFISLYIYVCLHNSN